MAEPSPASGFSGCLFVCCVLVIIYNLYHPRVPVRLSLSLLHTEAEREENNSGWGGGGGGGVFHKWTRAN